VPASRLRCISTHCCRQGSRHKAAGNCEEQTLRLQKNSTDHSGARQREQKPQNMQSVNLKHHFLIAMPNMAYPHFSKSLTYISEPNKKGALDFQHRSLKKVGTLQEGQAIKQSP